MIYNLTTADPSIIAEIEKQVGNTLDPVDTSSLQLRIASASSTIYSLLDIDNKLPACTLEVREHGILLHFQSMGQGKVWVVPFWQLHIQHNDGRLSLFAGEHQLRLESTDGTPISRSAIAGLYERMARSTGQDHDIYGGQP